MAFSLKKVSLKHMRAPTMRMNNVFKTGCFAHINFESCSNQRSWTTVTINATKPYQLRQCMVS